MKKIVEISSCRQCPHKETYFPAFIKKGSSQPVIRSTSTAVSGKKSTAVDHVTETGYSAGDHDGQELFRCEKSYRDLDIGWWSEIPIWCPLPTNYKEIIELLKDLEDPEPCELDHHGNCQAHGWVDMKEFPPARKCPQKRLKKILYKEKTDAVGILHQRYIGNNPERLASLEDERIKNQIENIMKKIKKEAEKRLWDVADELRRIGKDIAKEKPGGVEKKLLQALRLRLLADEIAPQSNTTYNENKELK